jgi:hypothetical protein
MEDRMEKVDQNSGSGSAGAAARKAADTGQEQKEPCDKAFNQETSRLNDADESCDDGVR